MPETTEFFAAKAEKKELPGFTLCLIISYVLAGLIVITLPSAALVTRLVSQIIFIFSKNKILNSDWS